MQHRTELVKGRDGILELLVRDDDGLAVDAATSPAPSASIIDSAGVAITGTVTVTKGDATGLYRIQLTAAQLATLDLYTVTWSLTVSGQARTYRTQLEVIDQYLVELGDIRDFDAAFEDTTEHPTLRLRRVRDQVSERLEQLCGVSFRRRAARPRLDGNGTSRLLLPHLFPASLTSGRILDDDTWTALTAAEVADVRLNPGGLLTRTDGGIWPAGHQNLELFYTHGLEMPPDSIRRAALLLIKRGLVSTVIADENVSSYTNDAGTFRLTVEGRDGPTGIPEVDAIVASFNYSTPAVG